MTPSQIIEFFQEALLLAAMLSLPALTLGLVVGLAISVFQAVTQINEQTLTLIPKIVAIFGALLLSGNWMLSQLMAFTTKVINQLAHISG